MSTSLRDQLLKAGLISKQQANEAERALERQSRQSLPRGRGGDNSPRPPAGRPPPRRSSDAGKASVGGTASTHAAETQATAPGTTSSKADRDRMLNRARQEKAEKKALAVQIKAMIEQNRLPEVDGGEPYNFVDSGKIRRIPVSAVVRERLTRGEIAIVRWGGRYDLVPVAVATRLRERDPAIFVFVGTTPVPSDDGGEYAAYSVPDDLIW